MRQHGRPQLRTFTVALAAHRCERWSIPARSLTVPAANAEHAREIVVGEAHQAAGVPPWRPCVRESLRFTTARAT